MTSPIAIPSFTDTHCHLFWNSFVDDLEEVIARARASGVNRIIIPSTNFDTLDQALYIAHRFEDMFVAAGIHPQDAKDLPDDYVNRLRSYCSSSKVIAIGEIGLDYHYDYCPKEIQKNVLEHQLELAKELDLPVILHNRDSDNDLINIISSHQDGKLRGQFHCFVGSIEFAKRALDLGFHISFTGKVTYKKSSLDEVIAYIPDDRLMIETDAPFMTPTPHRGKRNEPAYIPLIAERFASARQQNIEHIAEITSVNALRLFRIPNE